MSVSSSGGVNLHHRKFTTTGVKVNPSIKVNPSKVNPSIKVNPSMNVQLRQFWSPANADGG
jgi:hypothetical protein